MSDTEDYFEGNVLHIQEELSPISEHSCTSTADTETESEADRLSLHEENRPESSHTEYDSGDITIEPLQYNLPWHHHQQLHDVTSWNTQHPWNARTNLMQAHPTRLFRPFSPISTAPPLFRPFSPVSPSPLADQQHPVTFGHPYNQGNGCPYPSFYNIDYTTNPYHLFRTDHYLNQMPDVEDFYRHYWSRDNNAQRTYAESNVSTACSVDVKTTGISNKIEQNDRNETFSETLEMECSKLERKNKASVQKDRKNTGHPYRRHRKPPFSYCGMIITVIENSPQRRLSLMQIHTKLAEMFSFFRGSYTGWRDSVRHNLSHNACFVKDEPVSDDRKRVHYWRVDLYKVPARAFCLQRTVEGRTGEFKDHIHEEVGLPVIRLPRGITPGETCSCMYSRRKHTIPDQTYTPSSPHEVTHLRIPGIDDCSLSAESPEIYRSRDVANNSHSNVSFDTENSVQPVTPTTSSDIVNTAVDETSANLALKPVKLELDAGYHSIAQYIVSAGERDHASSAVENLRYLC